GAGVCARGRRWRCDRCAVRVSALRPAHAAPAVRRCGAGLPAAAGRRRPDGCGHRGYHAGMNTPAQDPELLYEGQWLRLVRRGHWESCERTHGRDGLAVLVIAVTPDDEVLFVDQYRVPLGARTIEMPAGLVGDDHSHDTLESAARRELIEETGWEAGRVDVLLVGPTSSG